MESAGDQPQEQKQLLRLIVRNWKTEIEKVSPSHTMYWAVV